MVQSKSTFEMAREAVKQMLKGVYLVQASHSVIPPKFQDYKLFWNYRKQHLFYQWNGMKTTAPWAQCSVL